MHVQFPFGQLPDCKGVFMEADCDVIDSIFNTLFAGTVYVVPGVRLIT